MADKIAVLTYLGGDWAAGRLVGSEGTLGRYIGWGTGLGVANKGDTFLFTEADESRVSGTVSLEGDPGSKYYQIEGTLTATSPKTITNAGTFTASTNGTLIVHLSFDGKFLDTDDQITFTFTIQP